MIGIGIGGKKGFGGLLKKGLNLGAKVGLQALTKGTPVGQGITALNALNAAKKGQLLQSQNVDMLSKYF
jgi:hypothetical protein